MAKSKGGARALWKGDLTLGPVTVPVKVLPAVKDTSVHFHLVDKQGGCRLRTRLVCPETGKEYDFKGTALGYEVAPKQVVVLDREELDLLKPESGQNLTVQSFAKLGDVDPAYFDRPYYLAPDKGGAKGYQLLQQALAETGRVAVVRFIMRRQEYLGVVRALPEGLCLETVRYGDEVRPMREVVDPGKKATVTKKEVDAAKRLIDAMTATFDPHAQTNDLRERVLDLIERKASGKRTPAPAKEPQPAMIADLIEPLARSLHVRKQAAPKAAAGKKKVKRARAGRPASAP